MKSYKGVYVDIFVFLISERVGNKWPASYSAALLPVKEPTVRHWIAPCFGLKTGLDDVEQI
jgi:hypothetical protein